MLMLSSCFKKSSATAWCFVLLLTLGGFVLPTAQAVTQLDGFNLEDDEQGVVRIRLNSQQPVQVEEQRQQGVYKLILKNTTISNKMKQEGLPVVMDAQGKYIARATQLANNQVSITIPNGVERHHQVQVVGSAANITEPTDPVLPPPLLPVKTASSLYEDSALPVAKKGLNSPKKAKQLVPKSTTPRQNRRKLPEKLLALGSGKVVLATATTKLLPEVLPVSTPLSSPNSAVVESGSSVLEETAVQAMAATLDGQTPLFTQQPELAFPSILNQNQEQAAEADLPIPFIFDEAWLNQRFLPENSPVLPVESGSFPFFPLASIAVGSALAVGLGLWGKQQGFGRKVVAWLHNTEKQTPLGLSFETTTAYTENNFTAEANGAKVFQTSDTAVQQLFSQSLQQQLPSVPVTPVSLPTSVFKDVLQQEALVTSTPPVLIPPLPLISSQSFVTPVVVKPSTPFGVGGNLAVKPLNSGSALQATLVQAIKQHDVSPSQLQRPAPSLLSAPSVKGDFRTVTQRFSNKKFQGIY